MTRETNAAPATTADGPVLGMIAGWGDYPRVLLEALGRQGYRVCCLGVKGHADPSLAALCHDFDWIGIGKLGRAIRYYHRHGVTAATMAGKIHKVLFYQPWVWLKHVPDWRGVRCFWPHFVASRADRKDDTLLGTLVAAFADEGIEFRPATDYAPELLVNYGKLSRRAPSRAQKKDIEFGWRLAKEMGRLDVGQSVAVKNRAPLAVEAIEGTDACIRRAGGLCPSGGFTVVKVAKPQQDMRFDVPTIGRGTLETLIEAGGRVLAVEADKTIIVNQPEVIELADRHGLVIVALRADGQCKFQEETQAA